jgi:hypothetical protein
VTRPQNNAMQLTRGGWRRVGASSSARVIVSEGEVVRPSQLIASVRQLLAGGKEPRKAHGTI